MSEMSKELWDAVQHASTLYNKIHHETAAFKADLEVKYGYAEARAEVRRLEEIRREEERQAAMAQPPVQQSHGYGRAHP